MKFNGLHLSKKYIPSAKTLYSEDLSNITFNYLRENSPNSYVIFETISHFSRDNSSVYFSSDITYFWQKYPIKMQIFRFSTTRMKINQIPCDFSSHESVFPKMLHHLSVSWHIIPLNVLPETLRFGQKGPIKVQIFRFLSALMKDYPIPHVSFETTRSRFIQILHHCSVSSLLCIFYLRTLYFEQQPIEMKFSDFWVVRSKFTKFLVMFGTTSQFLFKLFITLQCHEKVFCTFFAETVHDLDKRSPSKCKISDFQLLM